MVSSTPHRWTCPACSRANGRDVVVRLEKKAVDVFELFAAIPRMILGEWPFGGSGDRERRE